MHFTGVGLGDFIFFTGGNSTWLSYSDGNTFETKVAKVDGNSLAPQFSFAGVSSSFSYFELGNEVLFFNTDVRHGMELWSSDIASGGAHMLKDINRGTEGANLEVGDQDHNNFVALGDQAFFVANDSRHGKELWITDGTAGGTHMVKDTVKDSTDGVADINRSAVVGNEFYFLQEYRLPDNRVGYNIWHSDATSQGTERLPMTYKGHDIHAIPSDLGVLGKKILFEGFRDDNQDSSALYSYNTKTGDTQLVKDIATQYDNITDYTELDGELIFSARSKKGGQEIWVTDGTTAGTHQVEDIYTGPGGSDPAHLTLVGEGAAAAQTHADLMF